MNKKCLLNKTAIITGGNRGLGFASAKRFVEEGARVMIFSRDKQRNNLAVEQLSLDGGEVAAIAGSITSIDDIDRLITETVHRFGRIDVLFINHGITESINFLDISEEIYDRVMDTNTKGSFFTIQKAVPHMSKGSSIILCTSSSIHMALDDQMHYTASKQALDSFRRTMSAALVDREIRVNAICPGLMLTEMAEKMVEGKAGSDDYVEEARKKFVPIGRGALPEEVAEAAVFLASNDSSYMLGSEIIVDGGVSMVR